MNATDLGTFEVVADLAEVTAFRGAARLEGDGAVPFTYPIRWLALPRVRVAAMALVPERDLLPFHESQTFDYAAPLQIGAAYQLTVEASRETAPDRLVIRGKVIAAGAGVLVRVETVLRLLATGQVAG